MFFLVTFSGDEGGARVKTPDLQSTYNEDSPPCLHHSLKKAYVHRETIVTNFRCSHLVDYRHSQPVAEGGGYSPVSVRYAALLHM